MGFPPMRYNFLPDLTNMVIQNPYSNKNHIFLHRLEAKSQEFQLEQFQCNIINQEINNYIHTPSSRQCATIFYLI